MSPTELRTANETGPPPYLPPRLFMRRVVNPIMLWLGGPTLTVRGRSTGRPIRTPVPTLEFRGDRYLVSGGGETHWVRNLRAAGRGELRRGRIREPFTAVEVAGEQHDRVVAAYREQMGRRAREFFHALPDPADHPVFRIEPLEAGPVPGSPSDPAPASSTGAGTTRLGFWAAVLTVLVTVAFAAVGVSTPARSGPFCGTGCVAYPYVDVARFIPRDYVWLVPGILLAPTFVVLMACIHAYAAESKKIYSRIALSMAGIYAAVILVDYFLQFAVVVPSLEAGETDGLSLFTEYDPHGVFIALESLGYSMMTVAFLFAAAVFAGGRAERAIRGLFGGGFGLAVAAFVGIAVLGHDLVGFEVAVLMITWIVLILAGTLLTRVLGPAGTPR
jgi:deazaflavin-dependent oxidoreductase (nitroreductase family)